MREGVLAGISTGKGAVKIICDLQDTIVCACGGGGRRIILTPQIIFTAKIYLILDYRSLYEASS